MKIDFSIWRVKKKKNFAYVNNSPIWLYARDACVDVQNVSLVEKLALESYFITKTMTFFF